MKPSIKQDSNLRFLYRGFYPTTVLLQPHQLKIRLIASSHQFSSRWKIFISCSSGEDGGWSNWGEWGPCSKSCAGGTRGRARSCSNPPPSGSGKPCQGPDKVFETCKPEPCPCKEFLSFTSSKRLCLVEPVFAPAWPAKQIFYSNSFSLCVHSLRTTMECLKKKGNQNWYQLQS